jgi:hypothetical protein
VGKFGHSLGIIHMVAIGREKDRAESILRVLIGVYKLTRMVDRFPQFARPAFLDSVCTIGPEW